MIHAIFAMISGNLKLKRYLNACRIPDDADRNNRFAYEGKSYDRELFVKLVCRDFSRLTAKECLREAKALVDGLENSRHPELDRAYLEAFRRTLENRTDAMVKKEETIKCSR